MNSNNAMGMLIENPTYNILTELRQYMTIKNQKLISNE